jgi:hypothetical protein
MQETLEDLLPENIIPLSLIERKKLLPWWMKVFSWIFLLFGVIAPITLVAGIAGYKIDLSIYGLATNEPLSLIGILIIFIFALKGIVSLGLLQQKDWAVKLGIVDAVLGTAICVFLMSYSLYNSEIRFSFRLELVLLTPYFIKLLKIKFPWDSAIKVSH